jgi:hypothetical protein
LTGEDYEKEEYEREKYEKDWEEEYYIDKVGSKYV